STDDRTIDFMPEEPRSAEDRDRGREPDDVYAVDENYKQRHLWKITVSTAAEQQVTSGDYSVVSYRLSRDGAHIAMERSPTPFEGDNARGETWVMDEIGRAHV